MKKCDNSHVFKGLPRKKYYTTCTPHVIIPSRFFISFFWKPLFFSQFLAHPPINFIDILNRRVYSFFSVKNLKLQIIFSEIFSCWIKIKLLEEKNFRFLSYLATTIHVKSFSPNSFLLLFVL